MGELVLLAVGLDQHQKLQPLRYAVEDAQGVYDTAIEMGWTTPERSALLTEQSPPTDDGDSTAPTAEAFANLLDDWLPRHVRSPHAVLFFFSGYAVNHDGQDYFLLSDSDPHRAHQTGVAARHLFDRLKSLESDRATVILDISRPTAPQAGQPIGSEIAKLAEEMEIPVLLSCQLNERSRESRYLRRGIFTTALLAALRHHEYHSLAEIEAYLRTRLPQLGDQCWQPHQTSLLVATEPQKTRSLVAGSSDGAPEAIAAIDELKKPERSTDSSNQTPAKTADKTSEDKTSEDKTSEDKTSEDRSQDKTADTAPDAAQPKRDTADAAPQSGSVLQLVGALGAIAAFLMVGVIASPDSQSNADRPEDAAPTVTADPSTNGASDPMNGTANTSPNDGSPTDIDAHFDRAEALIEPGQATSYRRAIDLLTPIQPDQPRYAEAQDNIDRWSQEILSLATTRAGNGQFDLAIETARLIPNSAPIYPQARTQIEVWRGQASE